MLDQANINFFILYNLNEENITMKRLNFMLELSLAFIKFLVKRFAMPTLRLKLKY